MNRLLVGLQPTFHTGVVVLDGRIETDSHKSPPLSLR